MIPEITTTLQVFIVLVLHDITKIPPSHVEMLDREVALTNPHFSG
jgi:hypothetical protein